MAITWSWLLPAPSTLYTQTAQTELNGIRTPKRSSQQPAEVSRTNDRPRKTHRARPRYDLDPVQVDILVT